MILHHFNLREQPFGVTPDSRYLYATATQQEALASVLYGIESGLGFVALTAEPGMGKTTLLFEAMGRIGEKAKTVFLFQTISTPEDLLRALLVDLGIKDIKGSIAETQSQLNEFLVTLSATGKRLVVAIDEAQNLSEPVLEAVRMLSNFETPRKKLIQIILSGQPQLEKTLALPEMLQLRQRISIFARLEALSVEEVAGYIQHRLRFGGDISINPIFSDSAIALIAKHSKGIPRNINNICFNAMSLACALKRRMIGCTLVEEVLKDLQVKDFDSQPRGSKNPDANGSGHAIDSNRHHRPFRPIARIRTIALTVCTIVLILCWPDFRDFRVVSASDALRTNSSKTPSTAATSAPVLSPTGIALPLLTTNSVSPIEASERLTIPKAPDTVKLPQERLVQVQKGEFLSGICAEAFGECGPNELREIVRRNPRISDPNLIKYGQWISIAVDLPGSTIKKQIPAALQRSAQQGGSPQ